MSDCEFEYLDYISPLDHKSFDHTMETATLVSHWHSRFPVRTQQSEDSHKCRCASEQCRVTSQCNSRDKCDLWRLVIPHST